MTTLITAPKPLGPSGVSNTVSDIRTVDHPACALCGAHGEPVHTELGDWLYGVPGKWNIRKCPSCGAMWLDPCPIPDDVAKLYFRYLTHDLRSSLSSFGRLQHAVTQCALSRAGYPVADSKALLPRLLAHWPGAKRYARLTVLGLSPTDGGTLLDVGCGNGEFLGRMRTLGWLVHGVDPDPAAVACGQRLGFEVFTGTIFDVPEDACYDVITLNHVIEHVTDPVGFLRECRRRLRPGVGKLVITTPNAKSLGHRWFGAFWRGLEVPRHFTIFSTAAMRACLELAGFRPLAMSTETRLGPMIYKQSHSAKAGGSDVGNRTEFASHTKIAAHLFRLLESLLVRAGIDAGEEIFCTSERSSSAET
jgi:2-polyprenyl-3-methyl-5-hydroxy-6-metoxy-1,4-benzoquinol methylase